MDSLWEFLEMGLMILLCPYESSKEAFHIQDHATKRRESKTENYRDKVKAIKPGHLTRVDRGSNLFKTIASTNLLIRIEESVNR